MKQDGSPHDPMPEVIVEPNGKFDPNAQPAEYPHADLAALPHDVELSSSLLTQLGDVGET